MWFLPIVLVDKNSNCLYLFEFENCLVSLQNCMMYNAWLQKLNITSLRRQIEIDSKFLELQQIMDYSLLLGVHYRAPQQLHPYNQSRNADGLAILADEGGYLIRKLMICDLPLYG